MKPIKDAYYLIEVMKWISKTLLSKLAARETRLEKYTYNRPKCLVPVNNLPILFYAFKKFPKAKFQIICDYKRDVLEKYLNIFANEYDYNLVATNERGTCAGISSALDNINVCEPFMLMWSDLILSKDFRVPENIYENYVGISESFECRWSIYKQQIYREAFLRKWCCRIIRF
jgi:GTP:adenosylcobinamide-phosphate guanylyltransferase